MIPLANTDPSAIANAARCWAMCLGGSSQTSVKTYLLTKTADIATPPCVTPTAPGQPVAFQTLDTILKIRWTQPANSGSLIMSYTISWGTTQGGPYTSSQTIAGGATRQAILNGLTSGTTYYFVVKANSFTGCSSANSAEGSAATTGTPPSNGLLNSLTHYWKVDGAVLPYPDSLGTYALSNSGGLTSQVGIINTCFCGSAGNLLFTGSGVDATWQFGPGVSLTMQFWWNPSAFNSGFAGQNSGVAASSAWFLSMDAGGVVTLQVWCSDATTKSVVIGTLNLNQWNQVIAGYDSTNKIAFGSINGGARASVATTADLNQVNTTNVGFIRAAVGGNGNGCVDEIGWWRGRVLSTADVTTLYNGGAGLPFSSFQP